MRRQSIQLLIVGTLLLCFAKSDPSTSSSISSRSTLLDIRAKCKLIPGLTKEQLELCYHANDLTMVALDGLDLAVQECQFQFQSHRWNCSSLSKKSRNPHSSNLLKRGYRESAFAYAISSAGVAYKVAKACSQGRILSCSCDPAFNSKRQITTNEIMLQEEQSLEKDPRKRRKRRPNLWKWGGCSHNLKYGIEFSKMFLDVREHGNDIQSKINRHNNQAGRRAVYKNMVIQCKCHGMSGSCQLKTCWKSAPNFHIIGNILKQQFKRAILVDQSNNNGPPLIVLKKNKKRGRRRFWTPKQSRTPRRTRYDGDVVEWRDDRGLEKLESSLFYYQRSPNFCDQDLASDIPGTEGRRCNRTSTGSDSCSSMCCGRGYHLLQEQRMTSCHCKFNWCCHVECQKCLVDEYISVCN